MCQQVDPRSRTPGLQVSSSPGLQVSSSPALKVSTFPALQVFRSPALQVSSSPQRDPRSQRVVPRSQQVNPRSHLLRSRVFLLMLFRVHLLRSRVHLWRSRVHLLRSRVQMLRSRVHRMARWSCLGSTPGVVWGPRLASKLSAEPVRWPTGLRRQMEQKKSMLYCKYWCLSSRTPVSRRRDDSRCHQVPIFPDQNGGRRTGVTFRTP